MIKQFGNRGLVERFHSLPTAAALANSGQLDALIALEQIGTRRTFAHGAEIYAQGGHADCWFKVISGTVRLCKLMADGRRHIAEFFHVGDCFGLDGADERFCAAEAVEDVTVMRFPKDATERLVAARPELAMRLCNLTLRNLSHAQTRMMLLGRMTVVERVASFLLELAERRDVRRFLDLPMTRTDIGDYLGLTTETVCRALTTFKRDGVIAIPSTHRIEICDREALEALTEA